VVSSRLDPLPNVAIDAMQASTPVLCFDKACGIANLLEEQPTLHAAGVASYLDCNSMANKAVAMLRSPDQTKQIGALTKEHADRWFDMPSYINNLIKLANTCQNEVQEEEAAIDLLCEQSLVDPAFAFPGQRLRERTQNQRYLLSWRSNIRPRKPFPGFHPGIYRNQQLSHQSRQDPLVHWHQQGRPSGPWLVSLIQPTRPPRSFPRATRWHCTFTCFIPISWGRSWSAWVTTPCNPTCSSASVTQALKLRSIKYWQPTVERPACTAFPIADAISAHS